MKYTQNNIDVTVFVENNLPMPMSERFFPVEAKDDARAYELDAILDHLTGVQDGDS